MAVIVLLALAVTDPDPSLRAGIIASLGPRFDVHLAQSSALSSLSMTLNDESFGVRRVAMEVVTRLAPRNPAYVLPALRKATMQLLALLDYTPHLGAGGAGGGGTPDGNRSNASLALF